MTAPGPKLRGVTWNRPRGLDPLVACASLWRARTGVEISWEQRPSRDGAADPVAELARRYDLVIVAHAQVGEILDAGCMLPLNRPERIRELVRLAAQSAGESFTSYRLFGDQWALPLEAATHAQAWRPDRLARPPRLWDEVVELARHGRVLLPMRPPHALLVFFTLAANLGQPCAATGAAELNDPEFGASVLERMRALMAHVDPDCYAMDATDVFERLTRPDAAQHCAPLIEASVSYARDGAGASRLAFGDIAVAGRQGPVGATLGGAGIAVSAFSAAADKAVDFAFWLASGVVQRGPYADAGGQPANAVAWQDAAVNAACHNFYRDTWTTLDGAWVRPRHAGYLAFQHAAAERINAGLIAADSGAAVMADLNAMFAASFV
jgi:multiple sugar transport system substrate-binding protein